MEWVPITTVAEMLGVHRTHARRIAARYGVAPTLRQLPWLVGHRQRIAAWTPAEVDQILAARAADGFHVPDQDAA